MIVTAESHRYECISDPNDGLRIVHVARKTMYGIIPGVIWCWSHGTWEPIPQTWLNEEKRLRNLIEAEWRNVRPRPDRNTYRSDVMADLIDQYRKFRWWRPVNMNDRFDVYRFIDDLSKYAPAGEGEVHE